MELFRKNKRKEVDSSLSLRQNERNGANWNYTSRTSSVAHDDIHHKSKKRRDSFFFFCLAVLCAYLIFSGTIDYGSLTEVEVEKLFEQMLV